MLRVSSCLFICLLAVYSAAAQDRVTYLDRGSKTGATLLKSGTITGEDPGKVTLSSGDNRRNDILVSDIIDIAYDGEPTAEMNAARTAERERKYDVALAGYADALRKSPSDKKLLRRHLEYKVAEMRTAQADAGVNPAAALDALRQFTKANPDSRQSLAAYDNLGRLLVIARQPVNEVVEALAGVRSKYGSDSKEVANRCDLLRSDLILQDLELTAQKDGMDAAKGKAAVAAKAIAELVTIADRTVQPDLLARQTYCQAINNPAAGTIAAWETQLKSTDDPHNRAGIHLARGDYYRLSQNYKDAMWDYLWVDTVYFADRHQQARALLQLIDVFDKLGDAAKSRDCKERLQNDGRLRDTRQAKAAK
ncbi:MAG: hypothetical protein QM703_20235 [Gemmatales bacterium]